MTGRVMARSIASRLACMSEPHGSSQRCYFVPTLANNFARRQVNSHPVGGATNDFSTRANFVDDREDDDGETADCNGISTGFREVAVTLSRSAGNDVSTSSSRTVHANDDSIELVDQLLLRTSEMMDPNAANVVAYSGGVDSSLVAALVNRAFSDHNSISQPSPATNHDHQGSVQAVLGISPAVPQTQIIMARTVADTIGIPLTEVPTTEGSDETYQRNDGYACFVCKTHLYSTLETVANTVLEQQRKMCQGGTQQRSHSVILYNGTNADDTRDPTRLGLIAASNFQVHSPLDHITKDQVRQAAKFLGLPNWNAAASPCLRSRLAMGVTATEGHLRAVELAEEFVRGVLELDETVNARVRMLAGGRAMVELDNSVLGTIKHDEENWAARLLRENGFEEKCIDEWGFNSFGGARGFKTGSVAAMPAEDNELKATAAS
eukprot:CAMPEP_0172540762 /NCGR_PEP_ID=MMETSP1067-20121228/11696_1 /TAXON_ID=265564 ORGANISM="Thalassiosira punctigera, Strain Tpunct2005C2" /NCGR_SAMPLE_ID=MMETSP1067 /ASSEMBLY_ACC=CAM_ASM_000444 /LENGTH=435 /DNA_ID=CAMNT_0013326675 /DNA_START=41 /DNA_END=1348 /DNA_ORIENTATION=-